MQRSIPYMQLRGGSSKGLYFDEADLPAEQEARDRVLIGAMTGVGPNDSRQIDGLGGADPLTSKVGIVARSIRDDADLEYEFVQVVLGKGVTDRTQNCGNILAGVVPFAIETGMIEASDPSTVVRVYMRNSASMCVVETSTPGGKITYVGDARIDGVPGRSAPVICTYQDIAGSTCGAMLPTGSPFDVIEGVQVTCIDNGMPVVLLRASDFGLDGYESPKELEANADLKEHLERIRLAAGALMNLGDVSNKVVPKMTLIAPPSSGGMIHTRSFIPHRVHAAIGVLASVTVATGCIISGSVAEGIAELPESVTSGLFEVEHPSGSISVNLTIDTSDGEREITEAGVLRTARALSRGDVFLPEEK